MQLRLAALCQCLCRLQDVVVELVDHRVVLDQVHGDQYARWQLRFSLGYQVQRDRAAA